MKTAPASSMPASGWFTIIYMSGKSGPFSCPVWGKDSASAVQNFEALNPENERTIIRVDVGKVPSPAPVVAPVTESVTAPAPVQPVAVPEWRHVVNPSGGSIIKCGNAIVANLPKFFGPVGVVYLAPESKDASESSWENGERIVTAHNSHAANLAKIAALEATLERIANQNWEGFTTPHDCILWAQDQARATLAKGDAS